MSEALGQGAYIRHRAVEPNRAAVRLVGPIVGFVVAGLDELASNMDHTPRRWAANAAIPIAKELESPGKRISSGSPDGV